MRTIYARAHPRSRGENSCSRSARASARGSSPLTRGKPYGTPIAVKERVAHPRSRGENAGLWLYGTDPGGSSPLTRGKRLHDRSRGNANRLIPAHAGKTYLISLRSDVGRAHPRSRGENPWPHYTTCLEQGSSPLTRGKHFPTCAFTAQIDQILETLELAVSSGSYSVWVACATDAPQDQVRSIGLVLPSSRGAS